MLDTRNHHLKPFSAFFPHQNSMYNYKTYILNQKVVNLALEFWPAFCHFTPQPSQLYLSKFISNHPNSDWVWKIILSSNFLAILTHLETLKPSQSAQRKKIESSILAILLLERQISIFWKSARFATSLASVFSKN